jgi:hypothetical protein
MTIRPGSGRVPIGLLTTRRLQVVEQVVRDLDYAGFYHHDQKREEQAHDQREGDLPCQPVRC